MVLTTIRSLETSRTEDKAFLNFPSLNSDASVKPTNSITKFIVDLIGGGEGVTGVATGGGGGDGEITTRGTGSAPDGGISV